MKKTMVAAVFSSVLLLSACSENASEQVDNVLKDTFEAEKEYRDTQAEMEKLEKNEQEIFGSIMAMTQEQLDEVKSQADEALASADERLELLKTEQQSMEAAEEAFQEIDGVIEGAKDEAVKKDLAALKTKMQERFDAHGVFIDGYGSLSDLQKELYAMVADETAELAALQEKSLEVNEQNSIVQEAVTAFNKQTEQFNEIKNTTLDKLNTEEQ